MPRRSAASKALRDAALRGQATQPWYERVSRLYEHLSPGNQRVAKYLLESTNEAAFMSGSDLATALETDPATIVRFAQTMGYPGYPEMSAEIRASVRQTLDAMGEYGKASTNTSAAQWRSSLTSLAGGVQSLAQEANWKDARRFVKSLRGARQVLVVADASERLGASWVAQTLLVVGIRATAVDPSVVKDWLAGAGKDDVVLAIAADGDNAAVTGAVRQATQRSVRTLGIGGAKLAAEVVLPCASGMVGLSALTESVRQALVAGDE